MKRKTTVEIVEAMLELALTPLGVDPETGEVDEDAFNAALDAHTGVLNDAGEKAMACLALGSALDSQVEVLKRERESIDKAIKRRKSAAKRVTGRLVYMLESAKEALGKDSVDLPTGGYVRLVSRTSKRIDVVDPGAVPEALCTMLPSKDLIKTWVAEGGEMPSGCALIETKSTFPRRY